MATEKEQLQEGVQGKNKWRHSQAAVKEMLIEHSGSSAQ